MSWYNKITKFIESDKPRLPIGARSIAWKEAFQDALKKWRFPVSIECIGADEIGVFLYELRKTRGRG
jgi:hypothetical protein